MRRGFAALLIKMTRRTRAARHQTGTKERRDSINDDDAEWKERLQKRIVCIELIKESGNYRTPWKANTREPIPTTPNPYDRERSKRQWESNVLTWKKKLMIHKQELADPQIDEPDLVSFHV